MGKEISKGGDYGVQQRTVIEDGKVYNDWTQPARPAILDNNATIRNRREARKMDWGWPVLRIPHLDMEILKQRNPELASTDGQVKLKAWKKFLASDESLPYRVQPKTGGATSRIYTGD